MVNLADLAPTILEWMGAPAMDVDGRSFARLLQLGRALANPGREFHRTALCRS
jgi:arylsulfatase A-like enzyme